MDIKLKSLRGSSYKNSRRKLVIAPRYTTTVLVSASVCSEYTYWEGARGSIVIKALRYKPEGRGFDTQWSDFLNLPDPSGRTNPWSLLSL
jgi:hypothetical protein